MLTVHSPRKELQRRITSLAAREPQILDRIAENMAYKEIAFDTRTGRSPSKEGTP